MTQDTSNPATPVPVPTDPNDPFYDWKRPVLGDAYVEDDPVGNWLRYMVAGHAHTADTTALKHEGADLVHASADTMNSFWPTYKAALAIWGHGRFTLARLDEVLAMHEDGDIDDLAELFADFARITHSRANFTVMPKIRGKEGEPSRNLNAERYRPTSDYWDLTLLLLKEGHFDAFYAHDRDHIDARFHYGPMAKAFPQWAADHHMTGFLDYKGDPLPLWDGHLDPGAEQTPDTQDPDRGREQVLQFLSRVVRHIRSRAEARGPVTPR